MAKSDDAIEQVRSQYVGPEEDFATGLTKEALSKIYPILGSAISILGSRQQREIQREFNNHVLDILKAQEHNMDEVLAKISEPEIGRLAAVAVERIFWGASKAKAERFAAVLANEIASTPNSERSEDAVSFIRALDELSESDIRALRHLYKHQSHLVLEDRSPNSRDFFEDGKMERLLQDGIALEDFFSRCGRLSGYGLGLELDGRHGGIHPNMKAYRITILGRRLVDILIQGQENTRKHSDDLS